MLALQCFYSNCNKISSYVIEDRFCKHVTLKTKMCNNLVNTVTDCRHSKTLTGGAVGKLLVICYKVSENKVVLHCKCPLMQNVD